jgi:hypothetical protein
MKNLFFIVLVCFCGTVHAQTAHVESGNWGLQTGLLGFWGHYEQGVAKSLALRYEVGFDMGLFFGNMYSKTGVEAISALAFEPRYYYNLNKRERKGRKTALNTGNFFAFRTRYQPDWIFFSNYANRQGLSSITYIPTWGIRRHVGNHLCFEAGFGVAWQTVFWKRLGYGSNNTDVDLDLQLRLGYSF